MEIKTVYTKERLLSFYKSILNFRIPGLIIMGICNAIVFVAVVMMWLTGEEFSLITDKVALIVVADLVLLLVTIMLPRLMTRKAKNLNAEIIYTFSQDELHVEAKSKHVDESATVRYSYFSKIIKHGTELNLFIANNQAYIVDLSALSEAEQNELKDLLQAKTLVKPFKWQ